MARKRQTLENRTGERCAVRRVVVILPLGRTPPKEIKARAGILRLLFRVV